MLDIFFSPKDKATACGMWSTTYVIALIITLCIVALLVYLSRKLQKEQLDRIIRIIAAFAAITEVVKIVFVYATYGEEKVDVVPLYFCSLFIYATIAASFQNETVRRFAHSYLFFGGIMGATAFFIYPSACIPNYPIYHFMCIRTLMFHGLMIYTGLTIVITGYYVPRLRDFFYYLADLSVVCAAAYIVDRITGKNYMYLMKPIKVALSQNVYNASPGFYPFFVMLVQLVVPFASTYIVYEVLYYLLVKRKEKHL